MSDYYILFDRRPVPVDASVWSHWFETHEAERRVASTEFHGGHVSTVFLGLDHRFGHQGPPLLFETMIFGGPEDGYQKRFSTWEQAEEGHAIALSLARESAPARDGKG